jgi:hypothetical protein
MANTQKSCKGQPTVNYITNPTNEVIATASEFAVFQDLSPIFDTYGPGSYSITADIKTPKTGSITVYTASGGVEYNIGYFSAACESYYKTFYFNNINVTRTDASQSVSNLSFYGGYGSGLFPSIKNVQVEKNSFATPFVVGTRSSTQALLDLTGGNTITASNLTYASDNTFSFNGTTNELHPTINHSYLSSSALEVIFRSTSHGSGYKTIFGYSHNNGYSRPTIGSLYLENNTLSASVITASQVYRTATVAANINTNTYYHVVLNKNTSTGVLDIYVNGVLSGTQTFDAITYGQWTTAGSYIGSNVLDIGKSTNTNSAQGWSTDFFNGVIPVAKVYNRVLSAAEILQNFNALRGRYGL